MAIERIKGTLFVDGIPIAEIIKRVGFTPFYLYSMQTLRARVEEWKKAADEHMIRVHYAVKANNNLYLNQVISSYGLGATIVSQGELEFILRAGYEPKASLLHGNGKTEEEIASALSHGLMISVDSCFDAERISSVAKRTRRKARLLIRVNPHIDPHVHPYVATSLSESKFGISPNELRKALEPLLGNRFIRVIGFHCHLGSSILSIAPLEEALNYLLELANRKFRDLIKTEVINLGGGLGINYFHDDTPYPSASQFLGVLRKKLGSSKIQLIVEPGRAIVAECGLLVGRVLGIKQNGGKNFIVTDASMTELIRPPLYDAYHKIELANERDGRREVFDIVGPVCESADFLGRERTLCIPRPGDPIVIFDAGAYGFCMSSEYNLRRRPAEVVVEDGKIILTRKRGSFDEYFKAFTKEVI